MRFTLQSLLVIGLLCLPLATGCPGGGGEGGAAASSAKGLPGEWKIVKAEGSMASTNEGTVYEFTGDGKFSIGGASRGSYTDEDGKLTLSYDGMDMEMTATYELQEGDSKMVYKLENSDQVFHMERQ